MRRRGARVFRYGRESGEVLLERGAQRCWRLETAESANDRGMFALSGRPGVLPSRARRIGHYMFAGGMRQHASVYVETILARRRRLAMLLMLGFAAAWFALRWLPLE